MNSVCMFGRKCESPEKRQATRKVIQDPGSEYARHSFGGYAKFKKKKKKDPIAEAIVLFCSSSSFLSTFK